MNEPVIIVRTTERPGKVSYLEETITSMGSLGPNIQKIILVDGLEAKSAILGWETRSVSTPYGDPRGSVMSGWTAFKLAIELNAPWALLVEDDVKFCHGALAFMEKLVVPDDLAFVSFFNVSARRWSVRGRGEGLVRCKMEERGFRSTLAWKVPRRTIETLVARDVNPHKIPFLMGLDKEVARTLGPEAAYGVFVPNLVEHMGVVSACRGRKSRLWTSESYPGDDFHISSTPSTEKVLSHEEVT